jgi:hypothetical protein
MHEPMTGGGVLTNWLAIAGLISVMYWAWRILAAFRHRADGTPSAPRVPEAVATAAALVARSVAHPPLDAPGPGAPLEDIAAIAAAVTAMLGAHRIIHLEAASAGQWAFEGRWAQQTSHNPG